MGPAASEGDSQPLSFSKALINELSCFNESMRRGGRILAWRKAGTNQTWGSGLPSRSNIILSLFALTVVSPYFSEPDLQLLINSFWSASCHWCCCPWISSLPINISGFRQIHLSSASRPAEMQTAMRAKWKSWALRVGGQFGGLGVGGVNRFLCFALFWAGLQHLLRPGDHTVHFVILRRVTANHAYFRKSRKVSKMQVFNSRTALKWIYYEAYCIMALFTEWNALERKL